MLYQSFDMLDSICTDLDSGITMRLTCLHAPARYSLRQHPLAKVLALPALGSDHSPLLLFTEALPNCKWRKSFYFEAFWLQDTDRRSIIAESWTSSQP